MARLRARPRYESGLSRGRFRLRALPSASPQVTPLHRLHHASSADVRDELEERYEVHHGFWRSLTGTSVGGYLSL